MTSYIINFSGENEVLIVDQHKFSTFTPEAAASQAFREQDLFEKRLKAEGFLQVSVVASISPKKTHGFVFYLHGENYSIDKFDDFYHQDLEAWKKYKSQEVEEERRDLEVLERVVRSFQRPRKSDISKKNVFDYEANRFPTQEDARYNCNIAINEATKMFPELIPQYGFCQGEFHVWAKFDCGKLFDPTWRQFGVERSELFYEALSSEPFEREDVEIEHRIVWVNGNPKCSNFQAKVSGVTK